MLRCLLAHRVDRLPHVDTVGWKAASGVSGPIGPTRAARGVDEEHQGVLATSRDHWRNCARGAVCHHLVEPQRGLSKRQLGEQGGIG